jgi:hypothetical protein
MRANASERAMTTDVVAAIVIEQIPRKERFLTVRQKKAVRHSIFSFPLTSNILFHCIKNMIEVCY